MKNILIIFLLFIISPAIAQSSWKIKPGTITNFSIKNFGKQVHGTFTGLKGTIDFDPVHADNGSFDVTIEVNTINTGIKKRDEHLRTADFFDAEKYPAIHLRSTKVVQTKDGFSVTGDLTIKDKTLPVTIPFKLKEEGNAGVFTGTFTLSRLAFGVGKKSAVMGDTVTVKLYVEAEK
jgi:polyisoprenoid-binding protein YceI